MMLTRFCVLLMFLCAMIGCGKLPSSVSGQVTMDGAPLTTGNIAFNPVDIKSSSVAIGSIQPSGAYQVSSGTDSGLQPGEYIVTVVATKPPVPPVGNEAPKPPEPITPVKYRSPATSDLKVKIVPGSNTFSPDLKSK